MLSLITCMGDISNDLCVFFFTRLEKTHLSLGLLSDFLALTVQGDVIIDFSLPLRLQNRVIMKQQHDFGRLTQFSL